MALWKVKERKKECEVLSRVWLFATPWTVAYQPSPSMGFSRQGYWSGLLFPSPGDLPYPGIEPGFTTLQVDTLPFEPPECILKRCHVFLYQSRLLILPVFITGIVCVCVCVSAKFVATQIQLLYSVAKTIFLYLHLQKTNTFKSLACSSGFQIHHTLQQLPVIPIITRATYFLHIWTYYLILC